METEIALPGLDRDVVAMQLSDIHVGHHRGRKYLERIVEETNQRKPDIVLITGDLIDSEAASCLESSSRWLDSRRPSTTWEAITRSMSMRNARSHW